MKRVTVTVLDSLINDVLYDRFWFFSTTRDIKLRILKGQVFVSLL